MLLHKNIITLSAIGLLLSTVSCKKYLDVNTNPNVAQSVSPDLLLPSAEIAIASNMGVDMEVNGSIWAQYWTQNPNSSQYRTLEQYQPNASDYDHPWTYLYTNSGEDLLQIDTLATAQNKKQYKAISLILRAYLFQVITDAWGDVPYAEALKGLQVNGHIISPHYDVQKTVYTGILSLIDQGTALIDTQDPIQPGADDLIFNGDMDAWHAFANTLKLRVLMRMSNVDPGTAQAGIAALYATTPTFLDAVGDAKISFTSAAGNKNPLYAEAVGLQQTQNLVASRTCIDSMNSNNDPRRGVFYESIANGTFVGVAQGDYNAVIATGSYSIPSANTGGDATDDNSALAPVMLLSSCESNFLQAEAAVKGWAPGSPQTLFEAGIKANFASWGLTDMDASDYIANSYWGKYPTGASPDVQVEHIITQKWFAMCGNQGFEAWTEWRRTGYPKFFTISPNSLIGNTFPVRFLYPNVELTRNANFPGTVSITTKVWWDVN